ncbi:MAG: hypothetical protein SFV51_01225 [Bryobacteraceae bacterium]|nr:hypothetical protein [Bryobacteraceae bacterium]
MRHKAALLSGISAVVLLAAGVWGIHRYWPRALHAPIQTPLPVFDPQRGTLHAPGLRTVAEAGRYQDELYAYLMFDQLRGRNRDPGVEVLLSYAVERGALEYRILLAPDRDLRRGLDQLNGMLSSHLVETFTWWLTSPATLENYRMHTRYLDAAYNLPDRRNLDQLSPAERAAMIRRFIRMKSATDLRVRRKSDPALKALSREDAGRMAADIVTIADFYALPLEFFLGIGAMENNYLNAQGDLTNLARKRRPQRDDIVVKRTKTGVYVLNDSTGVWQITRETLRYVHKLYTLDTRDYAQLPPHLRPPDELTLNEVDPRVLTTYAGLLLRDLLDRFDGDVNKAVGAYNGGPGNPNAAYAAGVEQVAGYARRVLEQAAALQGNAAALMGLVQP